MRAFRAGLSVDSVGRLTVEDQFPVGEVRGVIGGRLPVGWILAVIRRGVSQIVSTSIRDANGWNSYIYTTGLTRLLFPPLRISGPAEHSNPAILGRWGLSAFRT